MTTVSWAVPIFGSVYAVVQTGTTKTLPELVAVCTCILTIKTLLLAMLTIRAKLVSGEKAFANKAESANLLFMLFKPMLLAYDWAPALAGLDASDRITRCVNNNKEFEPWLIGLFFAVSSVAKAGEVSKKGVVLVEDETELAARPVDAKAAQTRREKDKATIDGFVEAMPGGLERLNATITEAIKKAAAVINPTANGALTQIHKRFTPVS